MPFTDYDSFEQCLEENRNKQDAEAYCAAIHHEATGEWPGEKAADVFEDRETHLDAILTAAEKMNVEPDEEFLTDVREKAGYENDGGKEDSRGVIERLLLLGR